MDVTAELQLPVDATAVRPWVADLDRYPEWLSILARADRESVDSGAATWAVELRAKLGPLARSKRLRMQRTIDEADHLRFERDEIDGRRHSEWTLDVRLEPEGDSTRLVMSLHYGGGFGGGVVERLLADEIDTSKARLRSLLEDDAPRS